MSATLAIGVPAAVAAAISYNIAPLLQALAARRSAPGSALGLGLLGRLVRRPLWLAGLGAETAGFVLEVVALGSAPLILAQPVIAAGVIVLVIGGARILGERLSRAGIAGIAAVVAAAGLLSVTFHSGADVGTVASTVQQLAIAGAGAAVAAVLLLVAHWRRRTTALALGVASGTLYGVATVSTRQFGLVLDPFSGAAVVRLLASPAPYLLAVLSIVAIALLQRGLQAGSAVVVFPVLTGVAGLVPIVAATVVLGETIEDPLPFAAALALLAVGLAALSREPAMELAASA